ncbi:hypothetical protein QJ854_gp009 [Moumouvirus goulette]|uniref:Uncharacterized protein n=1 Tax=Moumouvirus goulette TaxID=1247379 RepID=M1PI40_9VIRU|nr:hypothetical protein QJ854_gp009 [Moumouvirus goulette]AGF85773.1 hypothetical protein glt_00970 [Moumouvirus goulette]
MSVDKIEDSPLFREDTMIIPLICLAYEKIIISNNGPITKHMLRSIGTYVDLGLAKNIYEAKMNIIKHISVICDDFWLSRRPLIFGGYHRDFFAKMSFKDIDLRFEDEFDVIDFIKKFKLSCNIKIKNSSYTNKGCYSMYVQHINIPQANVQIDATFCESQSSQKISNKRYDFDVNMLKSARLHDDEYYTSSLVSLNPNCKVTDIIDNCVKRQFIVLDYNGRPELDHSTEEYIYPVYIPDKEINSDSIICINRFNKRGKKLLKRIRKMKSRGWICINLECENPQCVLASDDCAKKYVEHLKEKTKVKI